MTARVSDPLTLVGQRLEPCEWFHIDQQRIDAFAAATEDYQFVHVDPARAAAGPFGTTIAHGFLTLSMLSHLASVDRYNLERSVTAVNYGIDKARFVHPVKAGSDIRAVCVVKAVEQRQPDAYLITADVTIEIRDEAKPALVVAWLCLVFLGNERAG